MPFRIWPPDSGGRTLAVGAARRYARMCEAFACRALTTLRDRPVGSAPDFDYREKRTVASLLIALERARLTKTPYFAALDGYTRRLAQEILSWRPDVVEAHMPWLLGIRRHLPPGIKVVALAQNIEALWYDDQFEHSVAPRFFRAWMRRLECRGLEQADHIVTLTGQDRDTLIDWYSLASSKISVIPPGFDPWEAPGRTGEPLPRSGRKRAVFVGSRFSGNAKAARALIDGPAAACADSAEVLVAGRVCDTLRGQSLPAHVRLLGAVDDLKSLLRTCDVFLNPSSMQTGINMKVLDALACGLRVVSTPEGCRGYEDLVGGAIRVASLDGFPDAIRQAERLSDDERRALRAYEWPEIVKRRLALYDALLLPEGRGASVCA